MARWGGGRVERGCAFFVVWAGWLVDYVLDSLLSRLGLGGGRRWSREGGAEEVGGRCIGVQVNFVSLPVVSLILLRCHTRITSYIELFRFSHFLGVV